MSQKEGGTMSREKQIEEMARILASNCGKCTECDHFHKEINGIDSCYFKYSDMIYNAGFRKQSEDVTDINVGNKSEWISVDERLPEPLVDALVFDAEGNIFIDFVLKSSGGFVIESVTHWMPLPQAPKMKGGAE